MKHESTTGSSEDCDDRNGYLPDFLGEGSNFLMPLPLLRDRATWFRSSERRRRGYLSFKTKTSASSRADPVALLHTGVNIDGNALFPFQASRLEDLIGSRARVEEARMTHNEE